MKEPKLTKKERREANEMDRRTCYERDSLGSAFKRVWDVVAPQLLRSQSEQRQARYEEIHR
jgi:hypothetical protein